MRTITPRALPVLVAFVLSVLVLAFVSFKTPAAHGSIKTGEEYTATTTYAALTPSIRTLKTTYGALGQVTITGANTGLMSLYDATTSDATKRAASMATSSILIADFPASAAAGTYTFDARFTNGLLLVSSGLVATSSIMYK